MIPFNKPFLSGKELTYIEQAVLNGKISGDGEFTKKVHHFFEERYGFRKVLLTTSCTDALEMAAILCDIQPGDEVIAPSFTFVSTVNPFVLRGARIKFCDVKKDYPCIDETEIKELITKKTKVIIITHYAGIACEMETIMDLAATHDLKVVEDAAHAIDSYFKGKPLGGIGHFGAFSFHETKNLIAGEGGMIALNDEVYIERAEIIREKGTNRSKFFRKEITQYSWVDIGSSFLASEIAAAYLYAQTENISLIQQTRKKIWEAYYNGLQSLEREGLLSLPALPEYATNNAHLFYVILNDRKQRDSLMQYMEKEGVMTIFHYVPLHSSPYYTTLHGNRALPQTDHFANCLLRLPLFFELSMKEVLFIISKIKAFYGCN